MQINHCFKSKLKLRTTIHYSTTANSACVDHASTRDELSLLWCAVVVEFNVQTNEIRIADETIFNNSVSTDFNNIFCSTCKVHSTCVVQKIDLKCIFSHLVSAVKHFTRNVLTHISICVEINTLLSVFVKETKLSESTFKLDTCETNTVYTTTFLTKYWQLTSDNTGIFT